MIHSMEIAGPGTQLILISWTRTPKTFGAKSLTLTFSKDQTTFTHSGMTWTNPLCLALPLIPCQWIWFIGEQMVRASNIATSTTPMVPFTREALLEDFWLETTMRDVLLFSPEVSSLAARNLELSGLVTTERSTTKFKVQSICCFSLELAVILLAVPMFQDSTVEWLMTCLFNSTS